MVTLTLIGQQNVISAVANISTEFSETVKAWSLATP